MSAEYQTDSYRLPLITLVLIAQNRTQSVQIIKYIVYGMFNRTPDSERLYRRQPVSIGPNLQTSDWVSRLVEMDMSKTSAVSP